MPPITKESVSEMIMVPSSVTEPCPSEHHIATDQPIEQAHTEQVKNGHPMEIKSIVDFGQQPFLFKELSDNIEMQPHSRRKRAAFISPSVAVVQTLTATAMAKRLHVSPKTLSKQRDMGTEHFLKWSRSKDPENKGWQYSEEKRCYLEIHSITQYSEK